MAVETDNLVFGRTNNPYDAARTTGGSSGGEGAIIAAGGSPLGIGSDLGGSIRIPAHFCGIAGLKPTAGRVPTTGHVGVGAPAPALIEMATTGPMARYVEDLAFVLPIIAGPDGMDPFAMPLELGDAAKVALRGLRAAWYAENGIVKASPETEAAVRKAASVLEQAGIRVEEKRPAQLPAINETFAGLISAGGGAAFLDALAKIGSAEVHAYTRQVSGIMDRADPGSAAAVWALLARRFMLRAGMLGFMRSFDVLISPITATPAPKHGEFQANLTEAISLACPFNFLGWPSVAVRAGVSAEGLPIGVQVAALPGREHVALAVAMRIEKAAGAFRPPVV
jgi:amidase